MATLNFSFAGESINAQGLTAKVRKFDLSFENPALPQLKCQPVFSVEYFHSINSYAENLNQAFYMAAREAGVIIDKLFIQITGNLDSKGLGKIVQNGYNSIDVALIVVSDVSKVVLEALLKTATHLIPFEENTKWSGEVHFSLNSIIHLN